MQVRVVTDFIAGIRNEVPFQHYRDQVVEIDDPIEAGRMIVAGHVEAVDPAEGKKAVAAAKADGKPLGDPRVPMLAGK